MICYVTFAKTEQAWWRLIKRLYYHSSLTFEYYKWQELSHTLQSSPSTNSVKQNLPLQLSCLTGEMYLNDQLAYVTLLQHYTLLMNGPHIWISTSGSPKTEVRTLFHKFFTANILFWEHLGDDVLDLKTKVFCRK